MEASLRRIAAGVEALNPVDFLLGVMRNNEFPLDVRLDAAVKVAPYMHPRLQAVVHTPNPAGLNELAQLLVELDGSTRGLPREH